VLSKFAGDFGFVGADHFINLLAILEEHHRGHCADAILGRNRVQFVDVHREEGDVGLVRESQRRRYKPAETVDKVIAADNKWKALRHQLDELNQEKNKLNEEIKIKKKADSKANVEDLVGKNKEIQTKIASLKEEVKVAEAEVESALNVIGNIVHETVPVSNDEAKDNEIVKKWGSFDSKDGLKHHHELLWMIDGYDFERGVKIVGHRGYFLKGVGVKLNFAIQMYALNFLEKKGYIALQTPFFMDKDVMSKTAQLEQFDEELYKVVGSKDDKEKYLIATSEQPISAFHSDERLDPKSLPLKYVGVSTCFRKEAGAHGKDTWGIFRVHQFEKIEQFVITAPEKSWDMHKEMIKISEEFWESLGIPYRVVNIVSGELNNAAAKKYDLEGWFPGFREFRELVSCSNCTDYQSRSLEIRFGATVNPNEREKKYVHMLNSTLVATGRGICVILENYQTNEGITVPEVLRPFMGIDFIPFVNKGEMPTGTGGKKAAQKTTGAPQKATANTNNPDKVQ